jgi:hypothetical protein
VGKPVSRPSVCLSSTSVVTFPAQATHGVPKPGSQSHSAPKSFLCLQSGRLPVNSDPLTCDLPYWPGHAGLAREAAPSLRLDATRPKRQRPQWHSRFARSGSAVTTSHVSHRGRPRGTVTPGHPGHRRHHLDPLPRATSSWTRDPALDSGITEGSRPSVSPTQRGHTRLLLAEPSRTRRGLCLLLSTRVRPPRTQRARPGGREPLPAMLSPAKASREVSTRGGRVAGRRPL